MSSTGPSAMLPDAMVQQALAALSTGDAAAIRELIHPYVHFTRSDGLVIRGRSRMLTHLGGTAPAAPASVELRDGQIYRWTESVDGAASVD